MNASIEVEEEEWQAWEKQIIKGDDDTWKKSSATIRLDSAGDSSIRVDKKESEWDRWEADLKARKEAELEAQRKARESEVEKRMEEIRKSRQSWREAEAAARAAD